jgi:hypothetical protein
VYGHSVHPAEIGRCTGDLYHPLHQQSCSLEYLMVIPGGLLRTSTVMSGVTAEMTVSHQGHPLGEHHIVHRPQRGLLPSKTGSPHGYCPSHHV